MPSQLPPPPQSFTSRDSELARLDQWLAESSGLVVAVISGAGGVGKTTLALEWLHRVRKRFPNGMLHADLGTFSSSGPAAPDHVLEFFLLALGTRAVDMPPDLPQRQALYRSMTADRAMIVLLDDAVSAAQVRPLLPAYGNTVVVVTSRRRLAGLSLDSARFLELGPLSVADSVQLMDNIVGAGRLAREQSQAEEIARLCGGMPLALSLVGARLSARPHRPVSREVGTLRSDDRLATLTVDESSVEAVFDVSYGELASSPARTYRMCSLHPGRQFSLDAAAAATGEEPDEVEESLSELVDCHLIAEISDRRFRYHDLLRLHARQQARWVDPRADREAAVRRMADWYLDRSAAADLALRPTRRRVGSRFQVPLEHPFPSHSDALRWLAVERHNLLDAVRAAAQHGWDEATWEFCEALWGFFLHARHYDDWLEMHKLGIPAAQRTGNTVAEARLRTQLVLALAQLHRYDEALDEGAIALRLAKQAQDEFTEAALLFEVAGVFLSQGDLDAALRHFKQAEQLRLKIGTERAVALCRRRIGETLVKLGRHDEALTTLLDVASTFAEIDRAEHARVLTILGSLYLDLDRVPDAASSLAEALRIARELGSDQYEAEALVVLGDAALRQGDVESARRHWTLARDHYSGNRDPKAAEMSVRLSSIPLPRNKDS
ncbi:tetratricopeptide repeat protein [Actinosynnema sp. ALI-1.44]|uniref:tetratricopeptide repeat protein n=1 Tax=Actinosynnema sp. ALI-1.44 TaxID=1933779 RepID=UPI00143CC767|nr:tetratricopeptide repeat protein [Actinosynnema sp. ALI-1.44]